MGGSLSPPTNAHFNVALEIGRKLRETKEKSRVCIVPVSPAYNKPSINEKCVPNQARLELAKSLVDALHLCTFKTPTCRRFMSAKVGSLCAF